MFYMNNYVIIDNENLLDKFIINYKYNYENIDTFINTVNLFYYDLGMGVFFNISNNVLNFYVFINKLLVKKNVKYLMNKNSNFNYQNLINKLNSFKNIHGNEYWGRQNIKQDLCNIHIANDILYIFDYQPSDNFMRNYHLIYYDMISSYNKTYKIKNLNYFIHLFDYPIYFKYKYDSFVNVEINSSLEINNKYAQILNATNSNFHKHIMIPYVDSWLYVNSQHKKINNIVNPYFNLHNTYINNWNNKKNIFFFRGTVTGKYYNNIVKNDRLRFAKFLDNLKSSNKSIYNLFDFSLYTNKLDIKIENNQLIFYDSNKVKSKFNNYNELFNKPKNYRNSEFKYIINIDGEVNAWRLAAELSYNSVILIIESQYNYQSWFYKYLKPYTHYIPIKNDLSNLLEEINKLIDDDVYAQKIAKNSVKFYEKYLTKNAILKYLHETL